MLSFIGFIFIVSVIIGVSFGEALGGFIWLIINTIVLCAIIAFVAWLFDDAS